MTNIILAIYAVFMLIGGITGYTKAKSKMSLIMGIASALIIVWGLFLTQSNPTAGYGLITATSAVLVATFTIRLMKTKKFMPSGMLVIVSIAALVVSIMQLV